MHADCRQPNPEGILLETPDILLRCVQAVQIDDDVSGSIKPQQALEVISELWPIAARGSCEVFSMLVASLAFGSNVGPPFTERPGRPCTCIGWSQQGQLSSSHSSAG